MLATFRGGLINPSFSLPIRTTGFRVDRPRLWQQKAGSMHGCTLWAQGAGAAMAALLPAALWPGTWPRRAEIPVLKEIEFDSVFMKAPLQPVRPPLVGVGTATWPVPQG